MAEIRRKREGGFSRPEQETGAAGSHCWRRQASRRDSDSSYMQRRTSRTCSRLRGDHSGTDGGDLVDGSRPEREEADGGGFWSSGEVGEGCCGIGSANRGGGADSLSPCEYRPGRGGARGGVCVES